MDLGEPSAKDKDRILTAKAHVVERAEPFHCLTDIFRLIIHFIVPGAFDNEEVLLGPRPLPQRLAVRGRERHAQPAAHNHLDRLRQQLADKMGRQDGRSRDPESVKAGEEEPPAARDRSSRPTTLSAYPHGKGKRP